MKENNQNTEFMKRIENLVGPEFVSDTFMTNWILLTLREKSEKIRDIFKEDALILEEVDFYVASLDYYASCILLDKIMAEPQNYDMECVEFLVQNVLEELKGISYRLTDIQETLVQETK